MAGQVKATREAATEGKVSPGEAERGHEATERSCEPRSAARALQLQRSVGNRATMRALARARGGEVATVLPADHPGERAADRLAEAALADRSPRTAAPLPTRPSRGGGRPLAPAIRAAMEGGFGADFAGVRVHDGARADRLSRSIGALAFTSGPDIFLRGGAPDPGSGAGRRLLAHELAHVVQQARAPAAAPVIQRYTLVNSAEQAMKVRWSNNNTFVRQTEGGKDFLKSLDADEANVVTHDGADGVTLKVSDNRELAIEAFADRDRDQAKAYYSTTAKITETNEKLAAVDSAFEMVPQGDELLRLDDPDGGTTFLVKVLPRNRLSPIGSIRSPKPNEILPTEGLGMFARQQCIDIAATLTGQAQDVNKEVVMLLEDGDVADEQVLARLLQSVPSIGVRGDAGFARSGVTAFRNALEELAREGGQAETLAAALDPLFEELDGCLLDDAEPSAELAAMLAEYAPTQVPDEVPALAKVRVLASADQVASLDGVLRDIHRVVQQFIVYRGLKRLHGSDDEDAEADFTDAVGINEYASPDVGQAYRIKYLAPTDKEWNYHWAGVVARDGDDSVTLENATRGQRKQEAKYHDARWYFEMYGVEDQSFHRVHTGETLTVTGVYAARPKQAKQVELDGDVADSLAVAARLADIRRALIRDSGDRSNASFTAIVTLLGECATLAIDAAATPEAYAELLTRIAGIRAAYAGALSTKRSAMTARNEALATMKTALTALKRDIIDLTTSQ